MAEGNPEDLKRMRSEAEEIFKSCLVPVDPYRAVKRFVRLDGDRLIMIVDGEEIPFGSGEVGATTLELRQALTDVQLGSAPDRHGWTTVVSG